jgi:hypothetical protein
MAGFSADCRTTVAAAAFQRLAGEPVNMARICGCRGDSTSKSWPWGYALAALDFERLEELADREAADGKDLTEFGSELYRPDVLAYQVAARALALDTGHLALADKIGRSLRASFAYLSLCALPGSKTATEVHWTDGRMESGAGDSAIHRGGVSVATAGHLMHPQAVNQGLLGPLLGWALGMPVEYLRERDERAHTWPLHLVERALSQPGEPVDFGAVLPASFWGLHDGDREAFRGVMSGGDPAPVVEALAGFPLFGNLETELTASRHGRLSRLNNSVNALKPQVAVASLYREGLGRLRYSAIVTGVWGKPHSGTARTAWTDKDTIAITQRVDGRVASELVYCRTPGKFLWRLFWDRAGARLVKP